MVRSDMVVSKMRHVLGTEFRNVGLGLHASPRWQAPIVGSSRWPPREIRQTTPPPRGRLEKSSSDDVGEAL